MSEIKHTPGPWRISDQTERDGLPSVLIHAPPEGLLAIVRVGHQGGYYGDANARLIASAPDMLEALCRRQMNNEWHNKPRIGMERECAMADAAIAKARGKVMTAKSSREHQKLFIASFDNTARRRAFEMLLARHGFDVLTDAALAELASDMANSHRFQQRQNRENRAIAKATGEPS